MTILILGPSEWLPRHSLPYVEPLREFLPSAWSPRGAAILSPLDIRVALAHLLTTRGVPAIVMEVEEPKAPSIATRKFHDLIEKHWVNDFYLYWPFGAARSGLDVEVGFLLERGHQERPGLPPDRVTIFYENDGDARRAAELRVGRGGRLEFVALERARRTRYYADLLSVGAAAVSWKSHSELVQRVMARSGVTD